MKLINSWSRRLSASLAVAVCVSPSFADERSGSSAGGAFKPSSYASIKNSADSKSTINSESDRFAYAAYPQNYAEAHPYAVNASEPMQSPYQMQYSGAGYQVPPGSGVIPAAAYGVCDQQGMPYTPGCDVGPYTDGCEQCADGCSSCGASDGLLGSGLFNRGSCGPMCGNGCGCGNGMGLADRFGGCGPLGCNGGTFGDGRYVCGLFGGCKGRLRGLCGRLLTPYGEGGVATQRWYDFSVEATAFRRDKDPANFNFTSQGLNSGNFVLSSNDVALDRLRAGLALQLNMQVGPGSSVEVGYFGLNKWSESATVNSTPASSPTLFSFISGFGTAPFNGFDDTDRSFRQSLLYESSFNNGEVNLRRRWVEPSGFLQGSYLAGIRYFQLDESLTYSARGENNNTAANNGARFYDQITGTLNQLTGFQTGGDIWLNVVPGVKVGTELKSGIYGNHAVQSTRIFANSLGSVSSFGIPAIDERVSDGRTAYITQLSVTGIYRLTYAWTIRSSGQLLYLDNVALAPENVNSQPPGLFLGNPGAVRNVQVNNDGEVLYTGFTLGAEYIW